MPLYTAHMDGKLVGKRRSGIPLAAKTYTHAVVIWGHGRDPKVRTWCSRIDLAQGEARKYQRWGFQTAIVPAEVL